MLLLYEYVININVSCYKNIENDTKYINIIFKGDLLLMSI